MDIDYVRGHELGTRYARQVRGRDDVESEQRAQLRAEEDFVAGQLVRSSGVNARMTAFFQGYYDGLREHDFTYAA